MTVPVREYLEQDVAEGGSALLTFNLVTELDVPVTLAQVGTLQFWLFNDATGIAINGKTAIDIKNANGGTVHATTGACTLALAPADNPIVTPGNRSEVHIAYIKCVANGGALVINKEIAFTVRNLVIP